ncbi:MAG: hypothetical protein Kow0069_39220 [Promethearchaeota archaeon]
MAIWLLEICAKEIYCWPHSLRLKMNVKGLLMDDVDRKIVSILCSNPRMRPTSVARLVNRSQPAVRSRILKMQQRGILQPLFGVDLDKVPLAFAKVDFRAKKPAALVENLAGLPCVVQVVRTSGTTNVSAIVAGRDERALFTSIAERFQKDANVLLVEFEMVTEFKFPKSIFLPTSSILGLL